MSGPTSTVHLYNTCKAMYEKRNDVMYLMVFEYYHNTQTSGYKYKSVLKLRKLPHLSLAFSDTTEEEEKHTEVSSPH